MIPRPPLSLNHHLQPVKNLQPVLVGLLHANGLPDAAVSVSRCNAPYTQCRNRFCIVCTALHAANKRRCLKERLYSTLQVNSKAVIWNATPTMLDTAIRHREKAFGLVASVRTFMRSLPIANWCASTEVELCSLGDSSLNIHAHAILVLDPPKAGRRYVRQGDWPEQMEQAWQAACTQAVDCHPQRLVTPIDAFSWAAYMTKPANFARYAATVKEQLKTPEQFLEQAEALHCVPRYFGPMVRKEPTLNHQLTNLNKFNEGTKA
jgi:hypothetical protein